MRFILESADQDIVEGVTLNREGRNTTAVITYRFGPRTNALRLRPVL
jgi:hypothetical protein